MHIFVIAALRSPAFIYLYTFQESPCCFHTITFNLAFSLFFMNSSIYTIFCKTRIDVKSKTSQSRPTYLRSDYSTML